MRKALILGLVVIMAVSMVPVTASAITDNIECDEYHNGNGMDEDCARAVFYMMEHGGFGDPL